jgi:hypothetical protein
MNNIKNKLKSFTVGGGEKNKNVFSSLHKEGGLAII